MKPLISDETFRDGDTRRNKDGFDIYLNGQWEDYKVIMKRHAEAMIKEFGIEGIKAIREVMNNPHKETTILDISGPEWDKFRDGLVVDE